MLSRTALLARSLRQGLGGSEALGRGGGREKPDVCHERRSTNGGRRHGGVGREGAPADGRTAQAVSLETRHLSLSPKP